MEIFNLFIQYICITVLITQITENYENLKFVKDKQE
jgi:hypothetical protein